MKKILLIFVLFLLFVISLPVMAIEPYATSKGKIPISVFTRQDCVHCQAEKEFLRKLVQERGDYLEFYYDISEEKNRQKFEQITTLEKISKATPLTLVGNTLIQGFDTGETTGKRIKQLLDESAGKKTLNFDEYLTAGGSGGKVEKIGGVCDDKGCVNNELLVNVPFYGPLNLQPFSLSVISAILGFIDGFNPCAMWVLVTFMLVLIQIGDRKRMFKIAGLFIIAETVMYYLILNIWFTTWDFIGLDRIVTPIIGMVAIGSGIFFLWEGWTSDGSCKVVGTEQKKKTYNKIQALAASPLTIASAIGVIGLALSINIIEFACSIGIPQTFTKILEINNLSWLGRQGQMLIYIFWYMFDDFAVFGLALWGANHLQLTQKYARWCNFIGGALMIILGYLLLTNPGALKFE